MEDSEPNEQSIGLSDLKDSATQPAEEVDVLVAQATAKYAVKDYDAAAELYSRATELQAEVNGEMSTANADLLYAYGRCLYHVAISKSDVLGSKVAGETAKPAKKSARKRGADEIASDEQADESSKAVEASGSVVAEKAEVENAEAKPLESKPYFQFTGDENFDESEEEDAGEDGEEGEEDELSNAYEVLDLARLLLERKIQHLRETHGDDGGTDVPPDLKGAKDRLADTFDLQAEISLEGERFSDAAVDLRAALRLKQDLHPEDSSLIAEAHYKLSLALEFSSVTEQKDGAEDMTKLAYVDEAMREEAAQEMELAIKSCSLRIEREEAALKSGATGEDGPAKGKVTRSSIDEVKEIVKDMQQRLFELRRPPVTVKGGAGTIDGSNPLNGILGSMLGQSSEAQQTRLEEAAKGANDLTNLVKRKRPASESTAEEHPPANGVSEKRKLDDPEQPAGAKKARVDDVAEE